jgi:hypothetical protein
MRFTLTCSPFVRTATTLTLEGFFSFLFVLIKKILPDEIASSTDNKRVESFHILKPFYFVFVPKKVEHQKNFSFSLKSSTKQIKGGTKEKKKKV